MAWGASKIAEMKDRVARIAPDNVPRETATPKLRVEFDDKRVSEAPAASLPETKTVSQNVNEPAQETEAGPQSEAKPQTQTSGIAAAFAIDDEEYKEALGKVEKDERELEAKLLDVGRKADPGDLHDLHRGSGYRSRVVNGQENEKSARQRKKQQDNSFTYQLLQQQLQQQLDVIDAEISRIDARVADIDKQLGEIDDAKLAMDELEELQANGKLDPNNPQHATLLRRAGIDPDEVEEDNLDVLLAQRRQELEQQEQALTSERDKLLQDREQLQTTRDKLAEAKEALDANPDSPATIDLTNSGMEAEIAARQAVDPNFDPTQATAQDVLELGTEIAGKRIEQRPEVIATESELFAVQLEQIDAPAGSPEYIAQVDAAIDGLTENTVWELVDDPAINETVRDRLRLEAFDRTYEGLEAQRETPEYDAALRETLEYTDERTKTLLLSSGDTPADVRTVLESQLSEERVQKFMQTYAKATTTDDQTELKKLAETLTPAERAAIEGDPEVKSYLEKLDNPPDVQEQPDRTAALSVSGPSI